jgi:hypothetical protein
VTDGKFAGCHFVENDAEREDVGQVGHAVRVEPLFGGHVVHGPDGGVVAGHRCHGLGRGLELCDAEIRDFGAAAASFDENVGRFEIAMHHPGAVRIDQSFADLHGDVEDLGRTERGFPEDHVEAVAVDVFHDNVQRVAVAPAVDDLHDVGVVELSDNGGFALEPGMKFA